jgi:hypothetical protein
VSGLSPWDNLRDVKRANIKVEPSTRDRLRAAKQGGETYDETINRLLDELDNSSDQVVTLPGGQA